jgi:ribonuclease Z
MSLLNALEGIEITIDQEPMKGFSISGLATWFLLPQLDICFDMGECPIDAVPLNHVFLTHAHGDHSRCLMRHYALRNMLGIEKEATYYLPEALLEPAKQWIKASAIFEGVRSKEIQLPDLQPLVANAPPTVLAHRKNLSVNAFAVDHSVPSLGYTINDYRLKLKPEFMGYEGSALAKLKKEGVEIQTPLHTPKITFIGDCTAQTLRRETHIWQSPILVLESTFIGEGEESLARKRGHTHLSEIADILREGGSSIQCKAIILKHFSMKVNLSDAYHAVKTLIPPAFLPKVHLLLPSLKPTKGML